MRRKIGFTALTLAGISFFAYLFILMSGNAFKNEGLTSFVFVTYIVTVLTAIACLLGDFIRFIGKMFGQGFNGGKAPQQYYNNYNNYNNATQNNAGVCYCPKCGQQNSGAAVFCQCCGNKIR